MIEASVEDGFYVDHWTGCARSERGRCEVDVTGDAEVVAVIQQVGGVSALRRPGGLRRLPQSGVASAAVGSAPRRHFQAPAAVPGWFIRASLPRPSTSCTETIATARGGEEQRARCQLGSSATDRPRGVDRARVPARRDSYQPRGVSLSCVPV